MEKLHQIQAITKLFPWGRLECDGSFNFDIARGRFRVLGGSGYGYWSHRGGLMPHSADLGNESSTSPYANLYGKIAVASDHIDGKDLLERNTSLTRKAGNFLPNLFHIGISQPQQPLQNWSPNSSMASLTGIVGIGGVTSRRSLQRLFSCIFR